MFNCDATGALSAAAVPVLVIAGNMDIVTKEEASRVIASSAPKAELKVVKGLNHMGFLEAHEEYGAAIEEFAVRVLVDPTAVRTE